MKQIAPAAERNKAVLAAELGQFLPATGFVLEIASGTGQHISEFGQRYPSLVWQPSDRVEDNFSSIEAWVRESALPNVLPPVILDAASTEWAVRRADVVINSNMIHIAPWAVAQGLVAGASKVLEEGGVLCIYGPFLDRERETAPSNIEFDAWLRGQNEEWGVRYLDEVAALARNAGFSPPVVVEMPANNLLVAFHRII